MFARIYSVCYKFIIYGESRRSQVVRNTTVISCFVMDRFQINSLLRKTLNQNRQISFAINLSLDNVTHMAWITISIIHKTGKFSLNRDFSFNFVVRELCSRENKSEIVNVCHVKRRISMVDARKHFKHVAILRKSLSAIGKFLATRTTSL